MPNQKEAIIDFNIDPDLLDHFHDSVHYGESKEILLIHIICLPIISLIPVLSILFPWFYYAEIFYNVAGKILDILDDGGDEEEEEMEESN